jgi:hypothetical protein
MEKATAAKAATAAVAAAAAATAETVEALAAAVELPLEEAREDLVVQVLQVRHRARTWQELHLDQLVQPLLQHQTLVDPHVQHHHLHQAARHLDHLHQVHHLVEAAQVLRVKKI